MSYKSPAEIFILRSLYGRTVSVPAPTSWYVGLLTAAETEPTFDPNYARQEVSNVTASFTSTLTVGDTTTVLLKPALVFGPSTVSWPNIAKLGFFDALTAGNLWVVATFNFTFSVQPYDSFTVNPETVSLGQQ